MQQPRILQRPALSKREAAELLGITQPTIDKLIKRGQLRAIRLSSSTVRILFQDLEDFLLANQTIPPKGFSASSPFRKEGA